MRTLVAVLLTSLLRSLLTLGGGLAGACLGFQWLLPSEPHCGLAVIPALFFGGGAGMLVGVLIGLAASAVVKDTVEWWLGWPPL